MVRNFVLNEILLKFFLYVRQTFKPQLTQTESMWQFIFVNLFVNCMHCQTVFVKEGRPLHVNLLSKTLEDSIMFPIGFTSCIFLVLYSLLIIILFLVHNLMLFYQTWTMLSQSLQWRNKYLL